MKCLKCENEAVHSCNCLKVERNVLNLGSSRQTTEKATGVVQVGLCQKMPE